MTITVARPTHAMPMFVDMGVLGGELVSVLAVGLGASLLGGDGVGDMGTGVPYAALVGNLLVGHPSEGAGLDDIRLDASEFSKLGQQVDIALDGQAHGFTPVACLLLACGPAGIPRLIIAIVVGVAVKGCALWTRPHVQAELLETSRVLPLGADRDPTPAVVVVAGVLWVVAPLEHVVVGGANGCLNFSRHVYIVPCFQGEDYAS